jgi:peptide/nickel transport system substrate-binding protein
MVGAGGVALSLALDACGGSSSPSSATSSSGNLPAGTPKQGGTLTIAATGGGSSDTLSPVSAITQPGVIAGYQLYEGLTYYATDGSVQLLLADELEPNKAGTQWTIRLRSGLTFHDGRPVTSTDLLSSLRKWAAKGTNAASDLTRVHLAGMKALDSRTVLVPMTLPLFGFPDILAHQGANVVPADFNLAHPVGTGPFKYVSFSPGRQISLARNQNYWQSPKPYLDTIVINNFADETAQVNALLSGQAKAGNNFSLASSKALESGGVKVLAGTTGGINPFVMNCAVAPFTDVRVRQAFKLIVDRPQMLQTVFGSYGAVANDNWGVPFDPLYNALPQRQQDLEQAKSLLKQAGQSGVTVKLVTAPAAQGLVQMAEVFAQQAKGAGVNVVLDQVASDALYGPKWLTWQFTQDFWTYETYLVEVADTMLPTSVYHETNYSNSHYTSLYYQAQAAADVTLRKEIAAQMQKIEYDEGGYIQQIYVPVVDAHSASVHGLQSGRTGYSFNTFDLRGAWID